MTDALLLMRHGWRNIWKQKTVWLFSALPVLDQLFRVFVTKPDPQSIWLLPYFAENLLSLVLFFVSFIAVPYLVYCFAVEKTVNVQEALSAVKKFAWRVLGCSCLSFFVLFPFVFLVSAFSMNTSTQSLHISDKLTLLSLPLTLFSGVWDFTMFEFFVNDGSIRKSLKNAWGLFIAHFSTVAIIGIMMTLVLRLYTTLSGVLTVLIQSGPDLTALSKINYINPSATFSENVLFVLINAIGSIFLFPFSVSVFALAYLEYSKSKTTMLSR